MMINIKKIAAFVCFGFITCAVFTCAAFGQAGAPAMDVNEVTSPLPRIADWFLSTGDWHNDPQLYVREFGGGTETIIMLNGGWGGEHGGFMAAVEQLKDEYHFVFYDQRGSLRSPSPDSLITFDRHIEDLELLRKALGLEKLNVVGHSMGTILASAYAAKYPERIKQLTLLAPVGLKNPVPEQNRDLLQQGAEAFDSFLNRPEVAQELEKYRLNRTDPPLSSQEETSKFRINFARRMLYDVSKWQYMMGGRALYKGHVFQLTANTYPASGWNYIHEFKQQAYPVRIIVGDHDFLDFDNLLIRHWTKEVPRIELDIIQNAGHIIWLDQPDIFASALRKALDNS